MNKLFSSFEFLSLLKEKKLKYCKAKKYYFFKKRSAEQKKIRIKPFLFLCSF